MSNFEHRYTVREVSAHQILTYLFVSSGQNEDTSVIKIIEYVYLLDFDNKAVFNLGFADIDLSTRGISDETMTGNGDVYRVFNTVLSTIPQFYEKYPRDIILVQDSDGREEFETVCKTNCKRNCVDSCRNYNRRMKTYCNYVTRKYSLFESDYHFLGGIRNINNWFDFESFIPGKLYDAIMVFQKNA